MVLYDEFMLILQSCMDEGFIVIKKGFGYLIWNVNDDIAGFDGITDGKNSFRFIDFYFLKKFNWKTFIEDF